MAGRTEETLAMSAGTWCARKKSALHRTSKERDHADRDPGGPRRTRRGCCHRGGCAAHSPLQHLRARPRRCPEGLLLRPAREPEPSGAGDLPCRPGGWRRGGGLRVRRGGHDEHPAGPVARRPRRRARATPTTERPFCCGTSSVPWGLAATFVDMADPARVEQAIRPETKLVWIETPSNPLLRVSDIERYRGHRPRGAGPTASWTTRGPLPSCSGRSSWGPTSSCIPRPSISAATATC